jgi:hypothetical protein
MKKICLAAMVSGMAALALWAPAQQFELKADLDPLLNFQAIWTTPADKFEQIYVPRTEGGQEKPPQFEWLDTSRSRARFSRQMFIDAKTELSLFGGIVKAEEAVVEFTNGRASRATVSIYNRGDSGPISIKDFEGLFRRTGQEIGGILKVAPKRQLTAGASALKTVTWSWTTPAGLALLEHNDFQSGPGGTQGKEHGQDQHGRAAHGSSKERGQGAAGRCLHLRRADGGPGGQGLLRGRQLPAPF